MTTICILLDNEKIEIEGEERWQKWIRFYEEWVSRPFIEAQQGRFRSLELTRFMFPSRLPERLESSESKPSHPENVFWLISNQANFVYILERKTEERQKERRTNRLTDK